MDVNGAKFHLVQGESDWADWLETTGADGLEFDSSSQSLSLEPIVERFRTTAGEALLTPGDRRGAECDRYGNWHWIGDDRRSIQVLPCTSTVSEIEWNVGDLYQRACPAPADETPLFRPTDPPEPDFGEMTLSGLAVSERHYMVVGALNPTGLLIFDLHGGGPPTFQRWPEEIAFEPFDITAAWRGGVWILGRGGPGVGARYWRLDSWLQVVPAGGDVELTPEMADQFKPVGGEAEIVPAHTFPAGFSISSSSPVEAEGPVSIVGLPDDSVLILDSPAGATFSRILRFRGGELSGEIALDPVFLGDDLEPPASILGHDMTFVPGEAATPGLLRGRLYLAAVDGNQAFGFDLEAEDERFELKFRPEQLPLRRFAGKALECCGGRAYYDLGDRWMPLAVHPRRRYFESATIEGLIFDGKLPDCHWRRVILDACIPNGASVTVESRAANEKADLPQNLWQLEPGLYQRAEGPEIPYYDPYTDEQLESPGVGAWETLFQSARGRWLELRLTLTGGGRLTPRLRAMRIYYPAFSYLEHYLPVVYREDPVSASFLDRYLANVEGLLTSFEGRVAAAEGLFDPRISPSEYLDWLAGWFGTTLDADWDDTRRRLFLAYAELLYRWRGTPAGLLAMIRLAIDPCPSEEIFADLLAGRLPQKAAYAGGAVRLVETFLTRTFGGVTLGDPTEPEVPGAAQASDWTPAQGAEPLHQRFRDFLAAKYAPGQPPANALTAINAAWAPATPFSAISQIRFSPVHPAQAAKAADWLAFLGSGLGFHYSPIDASYAGFYRKFLDRRWGRVDLMAAAYQIPAGAAPASFSAMQLPAENDFPSGGPRLFDWISFVSLAAPIRDNAHRFTVLVPSSPSESAAQRNRRVDVVKAVVGREKPAHTDFEVKPFWALFQTGSARLGLDTALGEGARFTAIELGRTALGEGFLAHGHPWNVIDRAVLGRDAVAEVRP